ncbi:protogenin B-like isoform X2 [Bacillus rossius redtenbacheri]|uniref:protogenin B-like isoform X2 n=1 Tax=Bacillus rossius redtenbacheri TaxID=93214 RepID=UPI002FDE15FE
MASRALLLCVLFAVGSPTAGSQAGGPALTFAAEPPPEVVVPRGRPANLTCSAPGRNVSWLRDGAPLDLAGDSRRLLLPDGTLLIKKAVSKKHGAGGVNASDQGEYRCVARDDQGTIMSRACRLRIAAIAQEFSKSPMNNTVYEDDVVRFMCQIDSVPKAVISWEKDGEPLPQDSRYLIIEPGLLYLSRIKFSDAGTYRCKATNPVMKKVRTSPGAALSVAPWTAAAPRSPEFLSHGEPVSVLRGADAALHCVASGYPPPLVSWSYKGPPASPLPGEGRVTSVLRLGNITVNQSGVYVCNATSARPDGGVDWAAQETSVDVLIPPRLTSAPVSLVLPAAKTARFNCTAEGHPPPTILWWKDGQRLRINGRVKQQAKQLVLSTTVTADTGVYQCVASSKAGEAWAAARLLVNASRFQPPPPTGLSCRTLSSGEVLLSVDGVEPQPNFKAYTFHFEPTAGGPMKETVTSNKTVIVDKLQPFTNYTFSARVYTTFASDLSKKVTCMTGEGVPLKSPKPRLLPKSPSTLLVSWSPLPPSVAQGVVTQYKIQWRLKDHPSVPTEFLSGNSLEYLISGLLPGNEYDVRVLAATSEGWSDVPDEQMSWSSVQMPSSQKNVPLAPVVHLTVLSPTSIEVTWKLPPANKYKPTRYSLYYRKRNDAQVGPVKLPATTTQYLLQDLDPETWYEVLVLGTADEGEGEAGVQSIVTLSSSRRPAGGGGDSGLFLGRLLPPTGLVAGPASPTAIGLAWTPAVDASYFTVCYGRVQAAPPANQSPCSYVRSTSNGVQVSDLKPHTLYEFKVRTHDQSDRYGPYSNTVECRTLEDGMVYNVQWKPINQKTVRVLWREPKSTNGVIRKYEVAVSNNTALTVDKWRLLEVPGGRTSVEVSELSANTWYHLMVRAVTGAGGGLYSPVVSLHIPMGEITGTNTPGGPASPPEASSQRIVVVAGVVVAVSCVTLAVLGLVLYRCCSRSRPPPVGGPHANGNGYCHGWQRRSRPLRPSESPRELECFSPGAATHIPLEDHAHLDTKGGYPNGHANGLKLPLLSNGRAKSGQAMLDRSSVNITENPQFQNGDSIEKVDACGDGAHSEPLLCSKDEKKCRVGEAGGRREESWSPEPEEKDLDATQVTLLDLTQPHSPNSSSSSSSSSQAGHRRNT